MLRLKQFIGLKAGDSVVYGEGIDAISGATISANSMTFAVDKVLNTMEKLNNNELLK